MQFPSLRPLKAGQRMVLIILPGLALLLLSYGLMFYQLRSDIQNTILTQLAFKNEQIERMLIHAEHAGQQLQAQPDLRCETVFPEMRRLVTAEPYVRSLRLLDQAGRVYCDTVVGWHPPSLSAQYPEQSRLVLLSGNKLTPHHPLLILWQDARHDAGKGVLVAVDSTYIRDRLTSLQANSTFYLRIGTQWLDNQGRLSTESPARDSLQFSSLKARHYPMQVDVSYSMTAMLWSRVLGQLDLLLLLFILSLLFSWLCHRAMLRSGGPRRELQRAVRQQEFIPYLQPLVRAKDLAWHGVEVLIRWQHPQEGLVLPDLFIPFAESTGQIIPMTRLLMQQVAARLGGVGLPEGFQISFNVSAAHVADGSLPQDCATFLAAFPANSILLTLELTERELIATGPVTDALFERLHNLGVRIAIDDFGTGHSSLSYLQKLDVDELKIDKSFVAGIGSHSLSADILDSILQLAAKLGLAVVAEGVDSQLQQEYLQQHDVHLLQGYRYARPMPLEHFLERQEWQPPALSEI
ncbi:MAG: cyclic diguanylate phosphodiesterase [Aquitalea sp.]|nr:cyclic diguanylate phosphodiesterase [Aquitalea sp.]